MNRFDLLVGAQADVNELLYISALQQTEMPSTRANGTISTVDIQRLLMSRYSVDINEKEAIDLVRALGASGSAVSETIKVTRKKKNSFFAKDEKEIANGDIEEGEEVMLDEYLDIVQILSLLLIPILAREATSDKIDTELVAKLLLSKAYETIMAELDLENEEKVIIDESFVRKILLACDEVERAADVQLIDEMTSLLGKGDNFSLPLLERAATNDLDAWKGIKSHGSTYMEDVRSILRKSEVESLRFDPNLTDDAENTPWYRSVYNRMADGTDFVLDSHTSLIMTIMIFAFYVNGAVVYLSLLNTVLAGKTCDENSFGCQLTSTIWKGFAIPFFLACVGVVVLGPLSVGNNPRDRSYSSMIISAFFTLFYAVVPYFAFKSIDAEVAGTKSSVWDGLSTSQLAFGCFLFAVYLLQALGTFLKSRNVGDIDTFIRSSNEIREGSSKEASLRKVCNLISNALFLHNEFDSVGRSRISIKSSNSGNGGSDQAAMNFVLYGSRLTKSWGIIDVWKGIVTMRLFDEEGLWLPTRLITFQVCQGALILMVTAILFVTNQSIIGYVEDKAAEFAEDPNFFDSLQSELLPSLTAVKVSVWPATLVAILTMCLLILIYLPSTVSTIAQYRSGQIPSLGSPLFDKYRLSVDMTYYNLANALYGFTGSAALIYLLTSLAIFLIAYHVTQPIMLQIIAWGIGLSMAIAARTVLTTIFRAKTHRAFYRKRPRLANIVSLLMECWTIGVGASVLVGRLTQFLLGSVFWLGRTDVHFLAPNVTMFGYDFDFVPTNFVKELLVHEAHRHPYIERLCQVYMLRLNDPSFTSKACCAWRQVVVQLIFPWMRKYRVPQKNRRAQAIEAIGIRVAEEEEEDKGLLDAVDGNLQVVRELGTKAGNAIEKTAVVDEKLRELGTKVEKVVVKVAGKESHATEGTNDVLEADAKLSNNV